VSNLVCACRKHNQEKNNLSLEEYGRLHGKDFADVKAQAKATLKDAAAVNATRWALFHRLKGMGLVVETGSGGLTKFNRAQRGLPKARWIDAACVGKSAPEKVEIANARPLRFKATGQGTRQKCSTEAIGINIKDKVRMARGLKRSDRKLTVTPLHRGDRRLVHRPFGADSLYG
jgi:hypothetical protein